MVVIRVDGMRRATVYRGLQDLAALEAARRRGRTGSWPPAAPDAAVRGTGHVVKGATVGPRLKSQGCRVQANRKRLAGVDHAADAAQRRPPLSVWARRSARGFGRADRGNQELLADTQNSGRDWHPAGHPLAVQPYNTMRTMRLSPVR